MVEVIKVFVPAILTFVIGMGLTPLLTDYLYRNKLWKKKSVERTIDGHAANISASLHRDEEKKVPRMGGVIIWASTALAVFILLLLAELFGGIFKQFDFLSRSQTWVPLSALLVGACVGLIDDYLGTMGGSGKGGYIGGGLSLVKRLLVVCIIALLVGIWFFVKLDVDSIGIPFYGDFFIGYLIIPLFVIVALGIYSGGVIDGIDGLAGGLFASMFGAYGAIAFFQNQIDLAALCAAVVGGTLAFLWFNIPPARFYMSETGTMGLTILLSVVAFMTDSLGEGKGLIVLPIIALPLVLTTLSNIIQLGSKRIRGKKVFIVAPLHHHFEALGWPSYKVTMRYWVVGVICATLGIALALVG